MAMLCSDSAVVLLILTSAKETGMGPQSPSRDNQSASVLSLPGTWLGSSFVTLEFPNSRAISDAM